MSYISDYLMGLALRGTRMTSHVAKAGQEVNGAIGDTAKVSADLADEGTKRLEERIARRNGLSTTDSNTEPSPERKLYLDMVANTKAWKKARLERSLAALNAEAEQQDKTTKV